MKVVLAITSVILFASAIVSGGELKLVAQKTDSGYFEGRASLIVDLFVVNNSTRSILLTESSCSYYESLRFHVRGGYIAKWYCDANYPRFFSIKPKSNISYRLIVSSNSDSLLGNNFVLGYIPIRKRLRSKKWEHFPEILSDSILFPNEAAKDSLPLTSLSPKIQISP